MRNILKKIDRQIQKYAPDQFALRFNELIDLVNNALNRKTTLNGWKVFDYGTWKEYEYVLAYNVNVTNGQRTSIGTIPPPSGRTIGEFSYAVTGFGNYAGHAVFGVDPAGDNLAVSIGNQYSGGALNFTGNAYIRLREL